MQCLKIIKPLLIMSIMLCSGCAYPPMSEEADKEISTDYTYKIGVGDSVTIFVWGNPDISTTATVRPDGKITIPLAEDLLARGRTPSELARVMEKELGKYVRDPQVVIIVSGFKGIPTQQVRIIGQLSGSGSGGGGGFGGGFGGGSVGRYTAKSVPYERDMTLLDLMIKIGGLGPYSDGNRASIIRDIDGETEQFGIRIDDLIDDTDMRANVKILPGDIVIIPEAFF
ncbi:MAG: polysaccharide biosynthesis/export family protein [Methylobacter sp.]|uniref:polysaccharide biosynthesis/export family protein n=1 Tax=Methylobacter sp. TaxID=2051955 RepID=UPI00258ADC16|nr:polysaccharide biosynthesis/export family protein [Methylobacter sp.]MCL7421306.1 polysaccharide biosynthesis/export family protein [Methylobacter sp.]